MKKTRFDGKSSTPPKNKEGFSNLTSLVVLGVVVAALTVLGILIYSKSSNTVTAQIKNESPEKKKYVATRNIVVDNVTGQARKPNDEELKQLVESLAVLTKRSDENPTSSAGVNGGISMDLDGGYGGTMLARPNPDGTMETKCVFTFQEAADFLGLVEDDK